MYRHRATWQFAWVLGVELASFFPVLLAFCILMQLRHPSTLALDPPHSLPLVPDEPCESSWLTDAFVGLWRTVLEHPLQAAAFQGLMHASQMVNWAPQLQPPLLHLSDLGRIPTLEHGIWLNIPANTPLPLPPLPPPSIAKPFVPTPDGLFPMAVLDAHWIPGSFWPKDAIANGTASPPCNTQHLVLFRQDQVVIGSDAGTIKTSARITLRTRPRWWDAVNYKAADHVAILHSDVPHEPRRIFAMLIVVAIPWLALWVVALIYRALLLYWVVDWARYPISLSFAPVHYAPAGIAPAPPDDTDELHDLDRVADENFSLPKFGGN